MMRIPPIYLGITALAFGAGLLSAYAPNAGRTRFSEIDVERINVVEPDGKIRLVISNRSRSPGPLERGKPWGYTGGNRPGLIFYNDEETENGGLVFSGKRDSLGKYEASGSLTFDHYEQDQTIALQYVDGNGNRRAGLAIIDRPPIPESKLDAARRAALLIPDSALRADSVRKLNAIWNRARLYAGRTQDGASQVLLFDGRGRPKLRLKVDSAGSARIEFMNDSGRVVRSLGAESGN